ncbi:MAG: CocE/NonD family hydrolase [Steroidobacteraceae bacterium]
MTVSRRDVLRAAALTSAGLRISFDSANAQSPAATRWRLPDKNAVEVIDNEWIVLKDGKRLSARLWLPAGASRKTPAAVVWEYIPYRKRDYTRPYDDLWGHELAQYGVAYVRVDARGSGDSEGVLVDEYLDQELNDGAEVIGWLSRQPWSNGNVGMRGISWGGINTLQIAALAPPALKAIMPMCCTDTRYTDDAHYIGGALGLTDLQWGTTFKTVMANPPDPAIVGARWRELWQERLDATPNILEKWLSHQRNDGFWQHGSVSTDYSRIKCAVYIVDGWVDPYVNTVPRILANVKSPRKALIGPWAHNYPQIGSPGPSLDWRYEEVRWWKHWLAGTPTGIMDEPMLRAYMPYRTVSESYPEETPGRWVAEPHWPAAEIKPRTWFLNEGHLSLAAGSQHPVVYVADQIVGLQKPEWVPFPPQGIPGEQGPDDRKSLVFDSAPLDADIEILGHPVARIRVAANRRVAKLALRLCEVTAEGKSWLVTYGLLNLTHRDSDERPAALTPDQPYDVNIELSLIAHRFKTGSRIRLAVSESLWPLVWPSPEVVTLTLTEGASSLELPVRPPTADPYFPIPIVHAEMGAAGPQFGQLKEVVPDANGWYELSQDPPSTPYTVSDTGTTISGGFGIKETLKIKQGDNSSCTWAGEHSGGFKRGDWDVAIHSGFNLSSNAESFFIEERVRALDGGKMIFERVNKAAVKRDLM